MADTPKAPNSPARTLTLIGGLSLASLLLSKDHKLEALVVFGGTTAWFLQATKKAKAA